MKIIYPVLFMVVLISCSSDPVEITSSTPSMEDSVRVKEDTVVAEGSVVVAYQKMYTAGRYYKKLDKGCIVMLIHEISDSSCRFVFDTGPGTPYHAKLAGNLTLDRNGKATYSGNSCEALYFHFTENGISLKEYKCAQFRSRDISFDGLYTTEEPIPEDARPWLREFERGHRGFDFYASFTEPFFTLYFVGNHVFFDQAGERLIVEVMNQPFDPNKKDQTLVFKERDNTWEVRITKEPGSDGMSEITYPYNVILNGELYGGGGVEFAKEPQY